MSMPADCEGTQVRLERKTGLRASRHLLEAQAVEPVETRGRERGDEATEQVEGPGGGERRKW